MTKRRRFYVGGILSTYLAPRFGVEVHLMDDILSARENEFEAFPYFAIFFGIADHRQNYATCVGKFMYRDEKIWSNIPIGNDIAGLDPVQLHEVMHKLFAGSFAGILARASKKPLYVDVSKYSPVFDAALQEFLDSTAPDPVPLDAKAQAIVDYFKQTGKLYPSANKPDLPEGG